MKSYEITIPIVGHAVLTVEADSRDEAIDMALERLTRDDIEEWNEVPSDITTDCDYDDEHMAQLLGEEAEI